MLEPQVAPTTRNAEILFVDANAGNSLQRVEAILAASSHGQIRVVELDTTSDGVDFISRTLTEHRDFQVVHIVCKGSDGYLQLGNVYLCDANIESYASRIASWQMAFASEAEIRLYGCDLDSEPGKCLADDLSLLASTRIIVG